MRCRINIPVTERTAGRKHEAIGRATQVAKGSSKRRFQPWSPRDLATGRHRDLSFLGVLNVIAFDLQWDTVQTFVNGDVQDIGFVADTELHVAGQSDG